MKRIFFKQKSQIRSRLNISCDFLFFFSCRRSSCFWSRAVKATFSSRSRKCWRNDSSAGFAHWVSVSSVRKNLQMFLSILLVLYAYAYIILNQWTRITSLFIVHREAESHLSSDTDLEHPDGKNAETGKLQVCPSPIPSFLFSIIPLWRFNLLSLGWDLLRKVMVDKHLLFKTKQDCELNGT